jgi:hypothetical protein
MKTILFSMLLVGSISLSAQQIVGIWQQTEDKTCFQSSFEKSETEKELEPSMGSSKNAVAKIIRFDKKGMGEEGIFSQGSKKSTGNNPFQYTVVGNELQFKDKKSGIITQRFIIDVLSETTLKIHNTMKDCETKNFTRIK